MIAGLAFDRIRDRVALKLVDYADEHGGADPRGTRITLKLSQSLLASAVSASRPNVSRAVKELVTGGELVVDGDTYVLTSPNACEPRSRRNARSFPDATALIALIALANSADNTEASRAVTWPLPRSRSAGLKAPHR